MIIQNKKLDAIDPLEASKLTAEHGYLIIENSGATPEEFAPWNLNYGYLLVVTFGVQIKIQ